MKKIIISVLSAGMVFFMTSSSALAVKNRTIKKHAVLGLGALLLGPALVLHNNLLPVIPLPIIEIKHRPNRPRARRGYRNACYEFCNKHSRHHRPRHRHFRHRHKRHAHY